jgi:allantoicase
VHYQARYSGEITRVEVDTSHFKGNYPESCSIDVGRGDALDSIQWQELLANTKLQPHTRHTFVHELADLGDVTHARLNIFPTAVSAVCVCTVGSARSLSVFP